MSPHLVHAFLSLPGNPCGTRERQGDMIPDPEKIRELAQRGEAWGDSESRQILEHAIETGRGGCYLRLTPEQYAS